VVGSWAKHTGVKKTVASAITAKLNAIKRSPEFPAAFHMAASFQPVAVGAISDDRPYRNDFSEL
jgi:hypothetical protein